MGEDLEMENFQGDVSDIHSEIESLRAQIDDQASQLNEIKALVKDEEQAMRHGYAGYTLPDHVRNVLNEQRKSAIQALASAKSFRDDMHVLLRSLVLVAEMVGNGATHAEKGARIRGLVELLETGIDKLRKMDFEYSRSCYWPDIFRSDYPSRTFIDRIHELESQVEQLTQHVDKPI